MRTSLSKLLVAALAVVAVAGCDCGGTETVRKFGALAVVYPDPVDPKTEISSEVSEHKATYDLGAVFMGQTATLPIKVQNTGNGSMNLASIEIIQGTDIVSIGDIKASNPVFTVDFVPETSVEVGAPYSLIVNFQPETVEAIEKPYAIILKLVASNTEEGRGEVEITINGKGVNGVCNIEKILDFGAVAKNDVGKLTVPIRNPSQLEATAFIGDVFGSDAQAFTFTAESAKGNVTLPPNTQKSVTLAFSPTEVRPYFAFVKMRASVQCPEVTVTLQGNGVDDVLLRYWIKPDATKDLAKVDFGYASPGSEVRREVTFENLGNTPVNLTQLKSNSNEFKLLGEAGTADPSKLVIPGKSTKNIIVAFKPTLLGPRPGTLNWTSNLAKQPTGTFTFKGFGGGPDISTAPASTMAFGKVAYFPSNPGTFTKRRITVSNVGTAPVPVDVAGNLHVQAPTIAPVSGAADTSEITAVLSGYNQTNGLEARVGFNTAYIEVTITPTSVGQKSWEISIPSNDPDEAVVKIVVSADIQELPPCSYTVTPGNLNFGLVAPPGYRDLTVNIKNTGADTCLINNLGIKAGSDPTFELPGGPIDSRDLLAGDTLSVIVRAYPKGQVSTTLQTVTGDLEFFASSPTAPSRLVPLTATVAQGCLTIAPPDIDFGTVQRGCASSTRTVTLYNSCSASITINSINVLDGAGFPAGTPGVCPGASACPEFSRGTISATLPMTMPQGGSPVTFTNKYVPLDLGADQGTVAISVTQNGSPVTYIVTLLGRGDTVGQNTDVFSQDAKPKADILLAIDNSCSMSSYQQALATNFASFIQYAQAAGVDYNIAVIGADDDGPPHSGRFIFGATHPEKILTPNTPNVEQKFQAKVNVGTGGTAIETCLAPVHKALTAPLINNENTGFLRPDAKLAIVCVTDAPDQSSQSAIFYLSSFQSIKGSKSANSLTFNAIAGFNPNPPSGCVYDSGADNGKYAFLVTNTNGVKDEICTPNWATTLQQLGKTAFGFRTDFFLNSTPDLTNGKTIEVKIDGVTIPSTDSRGAPVWAYDSVANSVNFEPSFVPEPGQTMTITYYVTCFTP